MTFFGRVITNPFEHDFFVYLWSYVCVHPLANASLTFSMCGFDHSMCHMTDYDSVHGMASLITFLAYIRWLFGRAQCHSIILRALYTSFWLARAISLSLSHALSLRLSPPFPFCRVYTHTYTLWHMYALSMRLSNLRTCALLRSLERARACALSLSLWQLLYLLLSASLRFSLLSPLSSSFPLSFRHCHSHTHGTFFLRHTCTHVHAQKNTHTDKWITIFGPWLESLPIFLSLTHTHTLSLAHTIAHTRVRAQTRTQACTHTRAEK